jgi:type II secretory pathway pseudopilin PulG
MKKQAHQKTESGFSILTAIFVLMIMSAIGLGTVEIITGSSQKTVDEYLTQEAFDVAQGGLQYIVKELDNDPYWEDNTAVAKSFGPGSFTVTYLSQTANTATVRVDGTVQGVKRSVTQSFSITPYGASPFGHAIYTETDFRATNDSGVTVQGDILTGGEVRPEDLSTIDVDGTIVHHHAEAEVPIPDWDYWLAVADHMIEGNYFFEDGAHSGIYYVTGQVDIKNTSNFRLDGTIICRGIVDITNNINAVISAQGTNPAIVAEDQIKMNNNDNLLIQGFLVSMSGIRTDTSNTVRIEGGIVAAEEIRIHNDSTVDIVYDGDRAPSAGFTGGEGSTGGTIDIGQWRETF